MSLRFFDNFSEGIFYVRISHSIALLRETCFSTSADSHYFQVTINKEFEFVLSEHTVVDLSWEKVPYCHLPLIVLTRPEPLIDDTFTVFNNASVSERTWL
jgi:hypothetical protein